MATDTLNGRNGDSDDGICPYCKAKMVEYRHGMTVPLVTGLRALFRAGGGPLNLKELNLTRNQWDNFQKLRYWGLVFQVEVDGKRKKGVWQVTRAGMKFLFRELKIPKRVWTYRGEQIRSGDEQVEVTDVVDWYEKREDYIATSQPHNGNGEDQPELF